MRCGVYVHERKKKKGRYVFECTNTYTKFLTTFPLPNIILVVSHPVMIHYSVAASQISPSAALLLSLVGKQGKTDSPVKK
jgi:hypothetical protein